MSTQGQATKWHIGSGGIHLPGYVNIDMMPAPEVDWVLDLTKTPYEGVGDDSLKEIVGFHVFEHFPFSRIEQIVAEFYRILEPGGVLVLEMPDFDETILRVLESPNDNAILANVYGNQEHPGQFHHWGWNKKRLQFLFLGARFREVLFAPPVSYQKDFEPTLHVEAIK